MGQATGGRGSREVDFAKPTCLVWAAEAAPTAFRCPSGLQVHRTDDQAAPHARTQEPGNPPPAAAAAAAATTPVQHPPQEAQQQADVAMTSPPQAAAAAAADDPADPAAGGLPMQTPRSESRPPPEVSLEEVVGTRCGDVLLRHTILKVCVWTWQGGVLPAQRLSSVGAGPACQRAAAARLPLASPLNPLSPCDSPSPALPCPGSRTTSRAVRT